MAFPHKYIIFLPFAVIALIALYERANPQYAAMYTDSHNVEWRIPVYNAINLAVEFVIDIVPRASFKFKRIDTTFDIDNGEYIQSSELYIFFGAGLGLLLVIIFSLIAIFRHCRKCCGGNRFPVLGYTTSQIDSLRGSILVFSFLVEGLLIYSFFTNNDLDTAMNTLTERFKDYSNDLQTQFDTIIKALPDSLSTFYDRKLFEDDMGYSAHIAKVQSDKTIYLFEYFEKFRMLLIIVGLVGSTLACSVGIAAGAVHKSGPIIFMFVVSCFSILVLIFSFVVHFSGAKILREFCLDSEVYFDERNENFLPQRLQFFIPCVSSPLYSYISDNFYVHALLDTNSFAKKLSADVYKPLYDNVSDPYYRDVVSKVENPNKRKNLEELLEKAVKSSHIANIIDQSRTCRWTKDMYREERFLMCNYTTYSLNMLTLAQFIAFIIMSVLTSLSLAAIKVFIWSSKKANNETYGINKGFAGRLAKPKRTKD